MSLPTGLSTDTSKQTDSFKRNRFPTAMFASAAICSSLMVFVISAVVSPSNEPCINSYELQGKVIIDTTHTNMPLSSSDQPLIICNRNNQQITWMTWLFKRSESIEFHYLDLLELLSRK